MDSINTFFAWLFGTRLGVVALMVGGVLLVILKPIAVGEYVKIGDLEGTVQGIGAFYTDILTFDGKHISMPNSNLTNKYTKEKKVSKKVSKTTKGVKTGDPGSNINFFTVMLAALLLAFVVMIYRKGRKESRI